MQYYYGAGGAAAGYQGFTTFDPILGAFCVPITARDHMELLVGVVASDLSTGLETMRTTVTLKADGSLSASHSFPLAAISADRIQPMRMVFQAPAAAEMNSRIAVEFSRGATVAKEFAMVDCWLSVAKAWFRISMSISTVVASPTTIVHGSGQSTITVTVKDSDGLPSKGVVVSLSAPGQTGFTLTQPAAPTDASGVATGTFAAAAAGVYDVFATADGIPLNASARVTVT